jgi:hypothetical protein
MLPVRSCDVQRDAASSYVCMARRAVHASAEKPPACQSEEIEGLES